ncbi:MAG: hypothetical protein ABUL71_01505, partial [Gemmatimonadota bacterium]
MAHVRFVIALAAISVVPLQLVAQSDQLAAGIHAAETNDLSGARVHFTAVLHTEPHSYEANWRLALVLIDIAKQTPDRIKSPARDSLYDLAESYAHRAVAAMPDGAEGHFALANAVGRAALSKSTKERLRRAAL